MKHGILPRTPFHELIQPPRSAAQHVPDVARVQHHALRFARRARGVDDRHHIFFRNHQRRILHRPAPCRKNIFETEMRRRLRPRLHDRISQRLLAASNHRRPAILHHRDQFGWRLPRIQRHHRQPLRHGGQIHRHPLHRVMRQQRATVALLQPQPPQISPRHQHLSQQVPRCERNRLPVAQFLQHYGIAAAFQARKNLFEKSHLFFEIVILSAVDDSRSESFAEPKDPYALHSPPPQQGILPASSIRTPPPAPATPRSSVADNPPSSTLRAEWETPDSAAALLLRNTRPCAPSISNSSPRPARSRRQSSRRRDREFRAPSESALPDPDHPHSSATPDARDRSSDSGSAHPS